MSTNILRKLAGLVERGNLGRSQARRPQRRRLVRAVELLEPRVVLTAAPIAQPESYTSPEDVSLDVPAALGVLANDSDADGNLLTAVLVSPPSHGTLTLNEDGSFTYTPHENFFGTDSFTYKASDGELESDETTVTITVHAANDLPVAGNDSFSVAEDEVLTIVAPGILANDSDVDGDLLTAVLVSHPLHGVVTLHPDGSFIYTPNADFFGTDGFSYRVSDGLDESDVAAVTIEVFPVADAPLAGEDEYFTLVDSPLVVGTPGVLANDTDADGDPLTAVLVSGPSHGVLTLSDDGSFTYSPDAGFFGTDSFTYLVSDGALQSEPATVFIRVSRLPVAADDEYSTDEDQPLTVLAPVGVLANDSDEDGDVLASILVSGPSHGNLTLNADGSFEYVPEEHFFGSDSFTYRASDSLGVSNLATVTINVAPVPDAPTAAADNFTADENTPLVINSPGVLANDSDADGDLLTAVLVSPPSHGTLTLNEDGSFTYTPHENFFGTDSFTYKASDGELESDETTVTITVDETNAAPAATADDYAIDEDTTLVIEGPGILANDLDPDGDPLLAVLVSGPAQGVLTLASDGSFTYVPEANFHGADSFTYRASDGALESAETTVTITIHPVNDVPSAVADTFSTAEDTPLVISAPGVLANDHDPDGDVLSAVLVELPVHGVVTLNPDGSFSYTPALDFHGVDSFSYLVSDGIFESGTATVIITVTPVPDAPLANDNAYAVAGGGVLSVTAGSGVLGNDFDADGDTLSAILVAGPVHGTLNLATDGSFIYTPAAGFSGMDSFTYRASDGGLESNIALVTLDIHQENSAPVAAADTYTVAEDGVLVVAEASGVLSNDTDADGNTLTAQLVSGPAHGTLSLLADGSFTYTPAGNFHGSDSFVYRAHDGSLFSAPTTVTLTVTAVNDAPVGIGDSYAATQGQALTVPALSGVLANDTDPDGDPLTAVLLASTSSGTLAFQADGSFVYTPQVGFLGTDSFTYAASDGTIQSAPTTVTISVGPSASSGVVSIQGPATGVLWEPLTFTLSASGTEATVSYLIDWNGDGTADQTVTGPATGVTVTHEFDELGVSQVQVTTTTFADAASKSVTISQWERRGYVLVVGGTAGDDVIRVGRQGAGKQAQVTIALNSQRMVALRGIKIATVYAGSGNDAVSIDDRLAVRAFFYGGEGDDRLTGGRVHDRLFGGDGDDLLRGGNGDDLLAGGDGDDRLFGGRGHDVLVGGFGADYLDGQQGFDLVIGSAVDDDLHDQALVNLIVAWQGKGGIQERMQRIRRRIPSLVQSDGLMVGPDGSGDKLVSSRHADWIFYSLEDDDRLAGKRSQARWFQLE